MDMLQELFEGWSQGGARQRKRWDDGIYRCNYYCV
jgi:hypothetical protein